MKPIPKTEKEVTDDPNEPDFEMLGFDPTRPMAWGRAKCVCGNIVVMHTPGYVRCGKCMRERRYGTPEQAAAEGARI